MYSIRFILIFLLASVYTSCVPNAIEKDMISLDQAFIPVWYYASFGDIESSRKAMYPLNQKWDRFQEIYQQSLSQNEDLAENTRLTSAWLGEVEQAIRERDVFKVLVYLDHTRYEWMEMRRVLNMDQYYLDKVWDLEASISLVQEVALDDQIQLYDWEEFECMALELDQAWEAIYVVPPAIQLIPANPADQKAFVLATNDLDEVIHTFLDAVNQADGDCFAYAARDLEPAYLAFIKVFGDFESTKTYLAESKN